MQLAFEYWNRSEFNSDASLQWLFLHGMGGTGKLWRPVAASIEDRFEVYAVDQRGHGGSRPVTPPDFSIEAFGLDVAEFISEKNLRPQSLSIVGHSMGVRSAVSAAYQLKTSPSVLVLIDLGFSGPAGGGLGETLGKFLSVLPQRFPTRDAARDFMNEKTPDPSMAQYLMATGIKKPDGSFYFPFDPDSLIATQQNAMHSNIRPMLEEVLDRGTRVLSLRGETSRVWSEDDYESERNHFSGVPNITFETFSGTGHGLPFEKRKKFVERIVEFSSEAQLTSGTPSREEAKQK